MLWAARGEHFSVVPVHADKVASRLESAEHFGKPCLLSERRWWCHLWCGRCQCIRDNLQITAKGLKKKWGANINAWLSLCSWLSAFIRSSSNNWSVMSKCDKRVAKRGSAHLADSKRWQQCIIYVFYNHILPKQHNVGIMWSPHAGRVKVASSCHRKAQKNIWHPPNYGFDWKYRFLYFIF